VLNIVKSTIRAVRGKIASNKRPDGILPPITRDELRAKIPSDTLEIGPFDVPFLKGARIEYFDILDQEQLRQRAIELSRNPHNCPLIQYTGKLSDVPRRFSAVFSSHMLEHSPDLAAHLEDVAGLLEPDGSYFLIIPDKRYCFDHFLPESTFEQVVAGKGRELPSTEAVINHLTRTTHNFAILHWLGLHGKMRNDGRAEREIAAVQNGAYVDVHQWIFTPQSFRDISLSLDIFESVAVHDTAFGDLEFMAILSGPKARPSRD